VIHCSEIFNETHGLVTLPLQQEARDCEMHSKRGTQWARVALNVSPIQENFSGSPNTYCTRPSPLLSDLTFQYSGSSHFQMGKVTHYTCNTFPYPHRGDHQREGTELIQAFFALTACPSGYTLPSSGHSDVCSRTEQLRDNIYIYICAFSQPNQAAAHTPLLSRWVYPLDVAESSSHQDKLYTSSSILLFSKKP